MLKKSRVFLSCMALAGAGFGAAAGFGAEEARAAESWRRERPKQSPKTRKALRENTCKIFSAARNRRRTAEENRTANVRFWKNQKKFFQKRKKFALKRLKKIFGCAILL